MRDNIRVFAQILVDWHVKAEQWIVKTHIHMLLDILDFRVFLLIRNFLLMSKINRLPFTYCIYFLTSYFAL